MARRSASAGRAEGGDSRTVTSPPLITTAAPSLAHVGKASRAAVLAGWPPANASAPASAAPSASVSAYPAASNCRAIAPASSKSGRAATASIVAWPLCLFTVQPAFGADSQARHDRQQPRHAHAHGDTAGLAHLHVWAQ